MHVLCRSLEQVEAAAACGANSLMIDLQDLRPCADAVRIGRAAAIPVIVATGRIHKPGETDTFRSLEQLGADGFLVRNLAGLAHFARRHAAVIADFSLGAANELTLRWLVEQGATRVTAAYDLQGGPLLDLAAAAPPGWLEVVIHRHTPLFCMEYCLFCALLSPAGNRADCGRPCARHDVRLRDRLGVEHPLRADAGCRNTVLHAAAQADAQSVPALQGRGVVHFRVELFEETADQAAQVIRPYRDLLASGRGSATA